MAAPTSVLTYPLRIAKSQFLRQFSPKKEESVKKKPIKKKVDNTFQITYDLLKEGRPVVEIAQERELTPGTIYSHIGKLIALKYPIDLNQYISIEKQEQIIRAANSVDDHKLKPLKDLLGENFTYDEIKLVLNSRTKTKD